jgi:hypothetical protein
MSIMAGYFADSQLTTNWRRTLIKLFGGSPRFGERPASGTLA